MMGESGEAGPPHQPRPGSQNQESCRLEKAFSQLGVRRPLGVTSGDSGSPTAEEKVAAVLKSFGSGGPWRQSRGH